MNLDRRRTDLLGHFRSKQLGLRSLGQAWFARRPQPRRMEDQQPRGVDLHVHVSQQIGDALVLDDRLVELHPVFRVGQRRFKCCPGDTQCLRGDADASAFKVGQGNRQALAALAEQIGLGDAAVVQRHRAGVGGADAHFVFGAIDDETRCVGRHQKR